MGRSKVNQRHVNRLMAGAAIAASAVSMVPPAHAQASPPPTGAANAADADTDSTAEIVVTAQKREERLSEIPLSVSVVTGRQLEETGALQFRDFANSVPGLSYSTEGLGRTKISLRGVGVGSDVSSNVLVYVDEVSYGSGNAYSQGAAPVLDVALFDLDRVEVLRGPQGTLYGGSSMGGLIRYVMNAPELGEFGATVRTGLSVTAQGGVNDNVSLVVNAPLLRDQAALRVSAYRSHDDGYIDNIATSERDINRSTVTGGRVDLLAEPTENFSIRLTGVAQDGSRDGTGFVDYSAAGVPVFGALTQSRLYPEFFDQEFRLASGVIAYDFGRATLTSVSSFQTNDTVYAQDASPLLLALLNGPAFNRGLRAVGQEFSLETDRFTQEVRLASTGENRFDWLIGGIYTDEDSEFRSRIDQVGNNGQSLPNDILTLRYPISYRDAAVFGNFTLRITSQLDITGGLRYSEYRLGINAEASGIFGAFASAPRRVFKENVATYLANVRYRFNDRAMVYFRYATGYRPGGANLVANDIAGAPVAPPAYEADSLASYEMGLKAETANGRISVEAAAFYVDWTNIQLFTTRGGVGVAINAPGGAEIKGAEFVLTTRPMEGLVIAGTLAYTDATLGDDFPDLSAREGDRLPNVPDLAANLNVDYRFSSSRFRPRIGATVRYVSDRLSLFGPTRYRLPDYTNVNLRAGVTIGRFDLQAFVNNLFDERGQLSQLAQAGRTFVSIQQPRTIGFNLTTRF